MRFHSLHSVGLVILILLTVSGCTDAEQMNPTEYFTWLQEPAHGLVQSQRVGSAMITVSYVPPELRAYNDMRGLKDGTRSAYDTLVRYHARTDCFDIQIRDTATTAQPVMDGSSAGPMDYCSSLTNSLYAIDDTSGVTVSLRRASKKTAAPILITGERDVASQQGCRVTVIFPGDDSEKPDNDSLQLRLTSVPHRGVESTFRFLKSSISHGPSLNPESAFVE